jgi:hypothetical protein
MDPLLSGTRVRPFVDGHQSVASHMSVDLGRSDVGVPEQLLDHSQIGAALEEMSRKRVP